MRNIKTVVLINLVLACLIIFTATNSLYSQFVEQEVFFDEFERTEIGNEYELRAPNWKIENGLLIHTGDGTFNPGFILLKNHNLETNFIVEVNIKWVQNGFFEDGIAVNYNKSEAVDAQHNNSLIDEYIFSYLSSWNNRVSTYSRKIVENEIVGADTSKSFTVNRNQWYKFKVVVSKQGALNKIEYYVNNELQITTLQSFFGNLIGLGGFKGQYGQVVQYDSLKVSKLIPDFNNGLMAYYPFTDGSAADSSGNGNNGSKNGDLIATTDRHGNPDAAISFDGVDDFISISNSNTLTIDSEITISSWVKVNQNYEGGIFNKGSTSIVWDYGISTYGSYPAYRNTIGDYYLTEYKDGNNLFGKWVHYLIVVKESANYVAFYVDGDKLVGNIEGINQNPISSSARISQSSYLLIIGKGHSSEYFNGSLDDIRIYNRALSDAEVAALYEIEKPANKIVVSKLDFEIGVNGVNWTWQTFENDSNPSLAIITNPDKFGKNTSDRVAKFTALKSGASWAGVEGIADSTFLLNENNNFVKILIWKSVISDVGIKLHTSSYWSEGEIRVANTKTNEWEELTFDFSSKNNPPNGEKFNGISIFPDFVSGNREQDNVIYIDNIYLPMLEKPSEKLWHEQGLVTYYPFKGNADDASGNEFHGTVIGPTKTIDRFGKSEEAYSFDGINDFIDVSTKQTNLPEANQPHTISTWVLLPSISPTSFQNLLSWGTRSSNQRRSLGFYSNQLTFVGESNDLTGSINLNRSQWYQVTSVYDGTVLKLFVNGVLDSFADKTLNTTGQKLRIGTIALPSNGEYFKGSLDDIRIYNRALLDDEVKALYEMEAVQETKTYDISLNTNAAIVLQDTISISVQVGAQTPIDSLYTTAFKLHFDTSAVSFVPEKTQVGTFLGTNPISFFRNEAGTSFVDASVGATAGTNYSGTGELVKLYFLSKKVENAAFSLSEVQALTKSGTGRTLIPKDTTVRIVASNIDPVKNLRVTSAGNRSVTLAWDSHASSDTIAYRIFRGFKADSLVRLFSVATNPLEFTDTSLGNLTTYWYGITAVTSYGLESPLTVVKHKSPNPLTSGLAFHYTFKGGKNDASGNLFDLVGSQPVLTTDRFGRANHAYSFNGNTANFVTPRPITLDSTSFTITFAEKKNTSDGHIVTHGQEAANGKFLHIAYTQNKFTVRFYGNDYTSSQEFTDNSVWRHWMIVYNREAKTRKVYLNNSLLSSEININQYIGTGKLYIGSNPFGSSYYNGDLDDIRLYTKALDENELKIVYETDNAPEKPSGLTALQESNSIKLNWNRSKESDLAFYFIERQVGEGSLDSLTVRYPTESPDTAYTDFNIKGSQTYTYRITAVDTDKLKSEVSAIVAVTTEPNLNDEMVAYYPFDGNTEDNSGNGNDLTFSLYGINMNAINRYNQTKKAIEITNGYLEPKEVFNSSKLSVSLWLKINKFSNSGWNTILSNSGGDKSHLLLNASTKYIGFLNNEIFYPSSQMIDLDEWYHLILVKDDLNSQLYVNSKNVQNSNSSFNNAIFPLYLNIIGNVSFSIARNQGIEGTLDDIRVFNRALTEDEVKDIYKLESEGIPPNPPTYQATTDDPLNQTISLSWLASTSPNVSLYRIYRGIVDTVLTKLVDFAPNTESKQIYQDTSITRGVTYFYEIKAVSNKGIESSPLVSTRSLDKLSSPEIQFINYSKTSNSVDITWPLSQALDANFYSIYRKTITEDYQKIGEVPHSIGLAAQYSDNTIEQNKVYTYSVSVTDKKGIESHRIEIGKEVFVLASNKIELSSLKIDNEAQNGKIKSKPTFKFNPVSGATSYKIALTRSGSPEEHSTVSTVYTWPSELAKGFSYLVEITPIFTVNDVDYDGETVSKFVYVYYYPTIARPNIPIEFDGSLAKADYKLVGFPGVIDSPTSTKISSSIPIQEKNTIIYSWTANTFVEFKGTPESGKAYWLLSDKTREVSYETSSVSLTADLFKLSVTNGWNLISNPFNETIIWDQNTFLEYPVFSWTGYGYNVSQTLEPGKGYIWKNTTGIQQNLQLDYYKLALNFLAKEIPKENLQKREKETPILHVFAKIGKAKERLDLQAVISESSTDTLLQKQVNIEVPPIPFEISTVYLPNDSLELEKSFIRRLIQYQENGIRCLIKADFVEDEWITWAYSFSKKQEDWECGLIDKQTAKWYPFTSDSVRLKLKKGEHEFVFVSGNQSFTDQVKLELLPKEFALHQNYPNPFNPITTIEFSLPESRLVRLEVFDIVGRNVSTLINTQKEAGFHSVQFNGSGLSSGVYLYRIQAGDFVQVKKLLLVK